MLFLPATINIVLLDYCGACGDLQGGAETLQLSLSLPLLSGHQPGGGGGGGNVGGGGGVGDVGGGVLVVRLELLAAGCQTSLRARTQCDQSRHPPQQNVDMQRPSEELCPELSRAGGGKD